MKLSQTGLAQHDSGSNGGGGAWIKDRDLVGYTITIHEVRSRHVDEHYGPDGTLYKEHDELIIVFSFPDEEDAKAAFLGDYVQGGRYQFSTNAKRIKEVLAHITGDMMPLEDVVILVDQDSRYQQLYLGEADTGAEGTYASVRGQSHPTGTGPRQEVAGPSQGRSTAPAANAPQQPRSARR